MRTSSKCIHTLPQTLGGLSPDRWPGVTHVLSGCCLLHCWRACGAFALSGDIGVIRTHASMGYEISNLNDGEEELEAVISAVHTERAPLLLKLPKVPVRNPDAPKPACCEGRL